MTNPTVLELYKSAAFSDQAIDPVVDAILTDVATGAYPLLKGWTLDLIAAINAHKASLDALLTDQEADRNNMVRTAILLAHTPASRHTQSLEAWG